MGIKERTLRYHLKKLADAKLIKKLGTTTKAHAKKLTQTNNLTHEDNPYYSLLPNLPLQGGNYGWVCKGEIWKK